jgi:hypothetical protein
LGTLTVGWGPTGGFVAGVVGVVDVVGRDAVAVGEVKPPDGASARSGGAAAVSRLRLGIERERVAGCGF